MPLVVLIGMTDGTIKYIVTLTMIINCQRVPKGEADRKLHIFKCFANVIINLNKYVTMVTLHINYLVKGVKYCECPCTP